VKTVADGTTTAYVVRNAAGEVVVAFWGASAPDEARRWRGRGYRVDCVELPVD
jgi:hypothetical protein